MQMIVRFFQKNLCLWAILLLDSAGLITNVAHAQFYSRQYAVVVGIDKYTHKNWRKLSYARKDAEAVATLLKQLDYTIYELYDEHATRANIISVLEDQLAPTLQKDDAVLFFFAGHGDARKLAQKDWGYIIPYDGTDKYSTYISMDELQVLSLKMDNAKHQAFIMDCCYAGLLGQKRSGILPINTPNYLNEVSNRIARQILTAGGPNQQVDDSGPNGHSVFTGCFLKAIQEGQADFNQDNWVSFNELVAYILPEASRPNQTPGYDIFGSHDKGDFLFNVAGFVKSIPKPRELTPHERGGFKGYIEIDTIAPPVPTGLRVRQREYKFRSTPQQRLSENAVKMMLVKNKFYDRDWNSKGTGIENIFASMKTNDDETVNDYNTGLMWQRNGSPNYMTFEQAQVYIKRLNIDRFGGFTDWRLPTLEEALSLLEPIKLDNSLFINSLFDNTQQWICTADKINEARVWGVRFNSGYCSSDSIHYGYYIRAVRYGQ